MPIFKYKNQNFFKEWSRNNSYILGFLYADGSLIKNKRGAYFIEIQITDFDLLKKMKSAMRCQNKISRTVRENPHWKPIYRLQVGSKIMFYNLTQKGMTTKKTKRMELPHIPDKYLCHFIRGYFDGDGNIWGGFAHKERKTKSWVLRVAFTSCSKKFLMSLGKILAKKLKIKLNLRYHSRAYRLYMGTKGSRIFYQFIYPQQKNYIYLKRKYSTFKKYVIKYNKLYGPVV